MLKRINQLKGDKSGGGGKLINQKGYGILRRSSTVTAEKGERADRRVKYWPVLSRGKRKSQGGKSRPPEVATTGDHSAGPKSRKGGGESVERYYT